MLVLNIIQYSFLNIMIRFRIRKEEKNDSFPLHTCSLFVNLFCTCFSFTFDMSEVFSGYSIFLNQENWPALYSWNIVESQLNTITLTLSKPLTKINIQNIAEMLNINQSYTNVVAANIFVSNTQKVKWCAVFFPK